MKKLILLIAILIAPFAFAQQQTFRVLPEHSWLTFDVSAQIHHVHGKSNAFSGTITGDPSDITTANIQVKMDPQTFDTDNKSRDQVMREKSLEVDKYPAIEFTSTSIESTEKQFTVGKPLNATIHGKLKLHGTEKEMAIPVTITFSGDQVITKGDLALQLDDWSIFRPKVVFFRLQNDITIHFQIGAVRTP